MRFKEGDKVTPKKNGPWGIEYKSSAFVEPMGQPKFGEIYTVAIVAFMLGDWCFGIEEFGKHKSGKYDGFRQSDFEKVVSDSVLRLELESVPEPFTI